MHSPHSHKLRNHLKYIILCVCVCIFCVKCINARCFFYWSFHMENSFLCTFCSIVLKLENIFELRFILNSWFKQMMLLKHYSCNVIKLRTNNFMCNQTGLIQVIYYGIDEKEMNDYFRLKKKKTAWLSRHEIKLPSRTNLKIQTHLTFYWLALNLSMLCRLVDPIFIYHYTCFLNWFNFHLLFCVNFIFLWIFSKLLVDDTHSDLEF